MKNTSTDTLLKDAGLKVTGPRCLILNLLKDAHPKHLSADDIYKQLSELKDVSIATIYRVLTQFEEAGLIVKHNFANDFSIYELNTGEHHDHLVCTKCGLVQEFVDTSIESRQQEIADRFHFKMQEHTLTIYGLCKTCQNQ